MRETQERLQSVITQVAKSANDVGRMLSEIKLIAVSKMHGPEEILPLLEIGHRCFGENRVQEAESKWPALKEKYPDIELHLIGPLQSNKAQEAVALFDVIQTIDRSKIAKVIADEMRRQEKNPKLFVQVNTGEESQKSGIFPKEVTGFVTQCQNEFGLKIAGLMCIPPVDEEPALHFALLAKKAKELGLKDLSMGMSADFETAIQFGATYLRVGTAIFGVRT